MGIERYPVDEIGMPLSVMIPDPRSRDGSWNKHHAWYQTWRFLNPERGATPGSMAVRLTKKTLIPIVIHDDIHDAYPDGLDPPDGIHEEAKHTLFNLAGRQSSEALRMSKGDIKRVELVGCSRQFLRRAGVVTTDNSNSFNIGGMRNVEGTIASFLLDYVGREGLTELRKDEDGQSMIGQFIETTNPQLSEERARLIIRSAAEIAMSPWEVEYKKARANQQLTERIAHEPADLVMGRIKMGIPDLSVALQGLIEIPSVVAA